MFWHIKSRERRRMAVVLACSQTANGLVHPLAVKLNWQEPRQMQMSHSAKKTNVVGETSVKCKEIRTPKLYDIHLGRCPFILPPPPPPRFPQLHLPPPLPLHTNLLLLLRLPPSILHRSQLSFSNRKVFTKDVLPSVSALLCGYERWPSQIRLRVCRDCSRVARKIKMTKDPQSLLHGSKSSNTIAQLLHISLRGRT